MAKVCYITHNKIETEYLEVKDKKETVTEVVKLGIGLIRSDVKDLVNIIEKAYRQLEIAEDSEEYGRTVWLKDIAEMCMQEMKIKEDEKQTKEEQAEEEQKDEKQTKEKEQTKIGKDSIKIEIDADGSMAYIGVKDFSKWYDEKIVRRFFEF